MNVLTFDIEEWYLEFVRGGSKENYDKYNSVLNTILDKLDETNQKATFFCLGEVAAHFPEVVKEIDRRGHDIGCHSNVHMWLNKMTKSELLNDTRKAVDTLEQCIGKKITSYRAPAFTIGKLNPWAFEVLSSCGISKDASVFPAERDFGGFPGFKEKCPSIIKYNGITMREFPVKTLTMFGKELAFSGGGYFRFFPLSFIKKHLSDTPYSMVYLHIADIIEEKHGFQTREQYESYFKEKGTLAARLNRYIKGNLGKKKALSKLESLLSSSNFVSVKEADNQIDWTHVPVISIS